MSAKHQKIGNRSTILSESNEVREGSVWRELPGRLRGNSYESFEQHVLVMPVTAPRPEKELWTLAGRLRLHSIEEREVQFHT
jgi:hypothetical protein